MKTTKAGTVPAFVLTSHLSDSNRGPTLFTKPTRLMLSRPGDLNPGPAVYETAALPLS